MSSTGRDTGPGSVSAVRVALVLVLGSFMTALDSTVMNIAIPALQRSFGTGAELAQYSDVAWTVSGYMLAQAAVMPMTDWASKRMGSRRLYVGAVALFTLTSIGCALSPSLGVLIVMRVLQGLGGGCLVPLGTTILARVSGPERLGRMMTIMGVPMLMGPVLGPIIGGWILQATTWHWIFLINVPFGVAAVIAATLVLPKDVVGRTAPRLDLVGAALMSPGVALVMWGVTGLGSSDDALSVTILAPILIGLAAIAGFVARSLRVRNPLLNLSVFRIGGYRRAVILLICFQAAFSAVLLIVPAYLQQARGLSSLTTGWLMVPAGIGSMVTMPIAGALVDRVPVGRIIPWGMTLLGASFAALTQVSVNTSTFTLLVIMSVMGLGLGGTMMPTATSALKPVESSDVGSATSMYNIVQQVVSAAGVAVVSVVLARRTAAQPLADAAIAGELDGSRLADGLRQAAQAFAESFWVPVALMVVGLIVSLFLPMRAEKRQTPLRTDENN